MPVPTLSPHWLTCDTMLHSGQDRPQRAREARAGQPPPEGHRHHARHGHQVGHLHFFFKANRQSISGSEVLFLLYRNWWVKWIVDSTSNFAVVGLINQLYLCLGCKEFECNPLRLKAIRISTFSIFVVREKRLYLQFPGTTVSYCRKLWPSEIEFAIKVWFLSYIGNQAIATQEFLFL